MFAANVSPEQNYPKASEKQKDERSFEYYLKAAKQGDAKAQDMLRKLSK